MNFCNYPLPIQGGKYKMGVQVVILNFHKNKVFTKND